MIVDLIEAFYRLLWGDLFTLPVAGGIGISFMVVLLFAAGIGFTPVSYTHLTLPTILLV